MERHMLDYRRLLEAGEWWVRAITGRERRATSGRKLAAVAELTEGYVRKGGSNAEKSQIQTRPAGPASMNPGGAAPPNVRRHRSCGF